MKINEIGKKEKKFPLQIHLFPKLKRKKKEEEAFRALRTLAQLLCSSKRGIFKLYSKISIIHNPLIR